MMDCTHQNTNVREHDSYWYAFMCEHHKNKPRISKIARRFQYGTAGNVKHGSSTSVHETDTPDIALHFQYTRQQETCQLICNRRLDHDLGCTLMNIFWEDTTKNCG